MDEKRGEFVSPFDGPPLGLFIFPCYACLSNLHNSLMQSSDLHCNKPKLKLFHVDTEATDPAKYVICLFMKEAVA